MSELRDEQVEQNLFELVDSLFEGWQIIDRTWRYRYVNEVAAAHGGSTARALVGRTMMEAFPGIERTELFRRLERCMESREPDRFENTFNLPNGHKRQFELRLLPVPLGVCVLSLDITDDRIQKERLARTEAQLRHAQKMEAVGRLAGGIAHDFNNLLSVVLSYSGLILADLPDDDPIRTDVQEIERAGQRAAALTRQLLAFSRQDAVNPSVVDVNNAIASMEGMLVRVVGENVLLRTLTGADSGRVLIDPGQLEQIVMNLVVNARDAMPRGGTIHIETSNVQIDEASDERPIDIDPGAYVRISVSDDGTGMDARTRERVFEPFFTTKDQGKGTGLGLSTVFGIVRQAGGRVWVESAPGEGTTFEIWLPRTDMAARDSAPRVAVASLRGDETILLVEDDDQLRGVAFGILKRRGYTVIEARNGRDAIAACKRHEGTIHLLLTDVIMPEMTGRELIATLCPMRPDMRILCMSGYTGDTLETQGTALPSWTAFLQKPITPNSLLLKVREVLERQA